MIADGQALEVRKQRIVRPEQLANIGGVLDRTVEISVVADPRRHAHLKAFDRQEETLDARLHVGAGAQGAVQPQAQRAPI